MRRCRRISKLTQRGVAAGTEGASGSDSSARGQDSAARHRLNSLGTQQRGDAEARRRSGAATQERGDSRDARVVAGRRAGHRRWARHRDYAPREHDGIDGRSNAWSLRGFVLEHRYHIVPGTKWYFGGRNVRVPQLIECFQFRSFNRNFCKISRQ